MNIVLLGTAPSSMTLAPFGNPEWEIWSCSPGTYGCPRVDRFFELHRWEPGQDWFSEGYVSFLENFPGPVMMSAHVPTVKNCQVLDYMPLVAKYGEFFFTSSLAWMLAMAIEQKPEKIALYGVDMAAKTEYHDQRLGCQYFALIAKSLGIEVGVPPESDLFRPAPLYGFCENSHAWIKQRIRSIELNQRLQNNRAEIEKHTKEMMFCEGALDDQDWQLHSWFGAVDALGTEYTSVPELPILARPKTNGEWTKDIKDLKAKAIRDIKLNEAEVAMDAPMTGKAQITTKKRGRPRKNA